MSTRRIILRSAVVAGFVMASGPLCLQPAAAEDTIKIGASFSVTGTQSSIDAPALNGAKLKVSVSGKTITINGTTKTILADVQVANGTVFLIDSVLMPA